MGEHDEFIGDFLEECDENLDQFDQDLVALEENPRDEGKLKSVFRNIHTVKGSSGFFGYAKIGSLAHEGESLLGKLRDGEIEFTGEIATGLLAMSDAIREILVCVEQTQLEGEKDYSELLNRLVALAVSEPEGPKVDQADAIGDPSLMDNQAQISSTDQVDEDPAERSLSLESANKKALGDTADEIQRSGTTPIDGSDEVSVGETPASLKSSRAPGDRISSAVPPAMEAKLQSSSDQSSIRVDVTLLDELMDFAGELVLARNTLNRCSDDLLDPRLSRIANRVSQVTSEIQERVTRTRMQPIGGIWSRFKRIVRDLAAECGKQVKLELEGQDTELDRSLLEAIKDPLTHLIRNCVDHGIESPDEREKRGKSVEGLLKLHAKHESGQFVIEVSDDGAGIDPEKIRNKAIANGLISAESASRAREEEILQIIFEAGFSTAEQVSSISGRGVGMDVVRNHVERIGGSVQLTSVLGQGTKFFIRLPLTLAIVPAVVVRVSEQFFAIPQATFSEVVTVGSNTQVEWVHDLPVCRLRECLLPLIWLDEVLECESEKRQSPSDLFAQDGNKRYQVAVIQIEQLRFGLVVDEVLNSQEIVVKPLGASIKSIGAYSAATILGDGGLALILDMSGIAKFAGLSPETQSRIEERGTEFLVGEQKNFYKTLNEGFAKTLESVGVKTFLLCEVEDGREVAIGMNSVERVEEVLLSKLQVFDSGILVNHQGAAMGVRNFYLKSLEDESIPLESEGLGTTSPLVICKHAETKFGLLVKHITDVVTVADPQKETGKTESRTQDSLADQRFTLVDERVVEMIDLDREAYQLREAIG